MIKKCFCCAFVLNLNIETSEEPEEPSHETVTTIFGRIFEIEVLPYFFFSFIILVNSRGDGNAAIGPVSQVFFSVKKKFQKRQKCRPGLEAILEFLLMRAPETTALFYLCFKLKTRVQQIVSEKFTDCFKTKSSDCSSHLFVWALVIYLLGTLLIQRRSRTLD